MKSCLALLRRPAVAAALSALPLWTLAAPAVLQAPAPAAPRSGTEYVQAQTRIPRVSQLPSSAQDLNAAAQWASQQTPRQFAGGRGGAPAGHLLQSLQSEARPALGDPVAPQAVGLAGLPFTSSKVGPTALDTTYPVRAVGKLYFKVSGAGYMCSASLIKPGVLVTAGHCVHEGDGTEAGWHTDFEFIPGYRKVGTKITKPYGSWTGVSAVYTTAAWYSGGGAVPNAGDHALIVLKADGTKKRVGDYTGWLGWGYPLSIGRQNTLLGYPANLDSGGELHRVDSLATGVFLWDNNSLVGSDMEGGSSGGPWVLNWRVDYSNSSSAASENTGNLVTSVTSWGFVATNIKLQGGSQFDRNFENMLKAACTAYPSACTP